MKRLTRHRLLAAALAALFAAGPALADKPEFAGGGKGERHEKAGGKGNGNGHKDRGPDHGGDRDRDGATLRSGGVSVSVRFGDRERSVVRDYFDREYRHGSCPPGLAKKHNGCMPPGQAKKWSIGRPLPRDVIYYDLPPAIVVELGTPPAGHRFVRVAADILLIAVGTGMVIDAIEDLGRM